MRSIKEIHNLFKQLSDQSQEGFFSHEEIDEFLDRAQMWLYGELKRVYGEGIDTHESMAPFVENWNFDEDSFTNNVLEMPADIRDRFLRLSALFLSQYDNSSGSALTGVEIVNDDELDYRLKSQLNPVKLIPIATIEGKCRWHIYPEGCHAGRVKFIRRPKKPFFKYTQVGREVVQDTAGSVDLEWNEGYHNQVLFKAIALAGFNANSEALMQAGLTIDQKKV